MVCAACAEHEQASRTASRSELEQSHEFRQIVYLQAVGGPSTTVGGSDPTVNGRALRVGAENPVTSCDVQVLVQKAAEPVAS